MKVTQLLLPRCEYCQSAYMSRLITHNPKPRSCQTPNALLLFRAEYSVQSDYALNSGQRTSHHLFRSASASIDHNVDNLQKARLAPAES